MKEDTARQIYRYIDPQVLQTLELYVFDRLTNIHLMMENPGSDISILQGEAKALRQLLKIRTEAESILK